MNGLLKTLAAALALTVAPAMALHGGAFALDHARIQSGTTYIAEDTTREILTTLHSRLDAFRKVQLPVSEMPSPETTINVIAPEAYGSLVAQAPGSAVPEYVCGERFLNRIWGGGLGTWQRAGRRRGDEGYEYTGQGVVLGIDRAAGAATFGIAASYVKGEYEDRRAGDHDSEIQQYSGHAYATYNNSRGFFFTLMGGFTHSNNEIREEYANFETADYRANTFSAGARMGFDFEPSESVVITPSVGANYFYSKARDHFVRDNAGVALSRYEDMKHNMVEIPVDITIAKEVYFGDNKMLQFSVNGGYAYNLNDKALQGDFTNALGNTSRIDARRLGRHAWKGGAGIRLKMDQWDIGAKYDYLARNDYRSHRVLGTVGFSF